MIAMKHNTKTHQRLRGIYNTLRNVKERTLPEVGFPRFALVAVDNLALTNRVKPSSKRLGGVPGFLFLPLLSSRLKLYSTRGC